MASLTEETRELILELAEDGELSKAEIARRTGVSRPTIYKVVREEGMEEPVSEEEVYAEEEDGLEKLPDEDEEEEYDDEDEDEEDQITSPGPIVLGSTGSAITGLVVGTVIGAAVLYGAMMRGIVGPPPSGRGGAER